MWVVKLSAWCQLLNLPLHCCVCILCNRMLHESSVSIDITYGCEVWESKGCLCLVSTAARRGATSEQQQTAAKCSADAQQQQPVAGGSDARQQQETRSGDSASAEQPELDSRESAGDGHQLSCDEDGLQQQLDAAADGPDDHDMGRDEASQDDSGSGMLSLAHLSCSGVLKSVTCSSLKQMYVS